MVGTEGTHMQMFTLNSIGVIIAVILGALVYASIGMNGVTMMALFLLVSAHITSYEYKQKKSMGLYDYTRGWQNVFSNGIMPLMFAVLSGPYGIFPFLGSMASIMADKMSSEIGVIDKDVYDILGFKRVKQGTNGGISFTGTSASLAGGMVMGIAAVYLFGIAPSQAFFIGICGLLGSLADSVAGHFEERGMGNKATSNIAGSAAGGLAALAMHGIGML
jgi:uncharacterized protein (TIGR00297 family)